MSSSNNASPGNTVINVRKYTIIPIPNQNQNQSTTEQGNCQASSTTDNPYDDNFRVPVLITWMVMSLFLGTYYIFPMLLPFHLCSFLIAVYGEFSGNYHFSLPYMLTVAWNTIYGIICVIFYITFYANDKEFFLNKGLYFCWEEKAEIFEKIGDNLALFVSHLLITVIEILLGIGIFFAIKQQYTVLQKRYLKEFRRVFGEQAVQSFRESLQQRGLSVISNEQVQSAQNLPNENPPNAYAQMLAQIPPPPSYQSNTILSPPQNGIPPPSYSMLEREEQLELDPLNDDASQQSINSQQLLSDITQNSNTTLSSPKNNSIDSTATISPSSILD